MDVLPTAIVLMRANLVWWLRLIAGRERTASKPDRQADLKQPFINRRWLLWFLVHAWSSDSFGVLARPAPGGAGVQNSLSSDEGGIHE